MEDGEELFVPPRSWFQDPEPAVSFSAPVSPMPLSVSWGDADPGYDGTADRRRRAPGKLSSFNGDDEAEDDYYLPLPPRGLRPEDERVAARSVVLVDPAEVEATFRRQWLRDLPSSATPASDPPSLGVPHELDGLDPEVAEVYGRLQHWTRGGRHARAEEGSRVEEGASSYYLHGRKPSARPRSASVDGDGASSRALAPAPMEPSLSKSLQLPLHKLDLPGFNPQQQPDTAALVDEGDAPMPPVRPATASGAASGLWPSSASWTMDRPSSACSTRPLVRRRKVAGAPSLPPLDVRVLSKKRAVLGPDGSLQVKDDTWIQMEEQDQTVEVNPLNLLLLRKVRPVLDNVQMMPLLRLQYKNQFEDVYTADGLVRDRDKNWAQDSFRAALNRLTAYKPKDDDDDDDDEEAPSGSGSFLERNLGRVAIEGRMLSKKLLHVEGKQIGKHYVVAMVYGLGIHGRVYAEGLHHPRYLEICCHEPGACAKFALKVSLPELKALFAGEPDLLRPGQKKVMCSRLLGMLSFEYGDRGNELKLEQYEDETERLLQDKKARHAAVLAAGFEYANLWIAHRKTECYAPGQAGGGMESPRTRARNDDHEARKMLILTPGAKLGRRARRHNRREREAQLRATGSLPPLPETPRIHSRFRHCIHTEVAHISSFYLCVRVFLYPSRPSNYYFHAYDRGSSNTFELSVGRFEAALLLNDPTLPPPTEWKGFLELRVVRRLMTKLFIRNWGQGKLARAALCIGLKQGRRGPGINREHDVRANALAGGGGAAALQAAIDEEKEIAKSAAIDKRRERKANKGKKGKNKTKKRLAAHRRRSTMFSVRIGVDMDWIKHGQDHAKKQHAEELAESASTRKQGHKKKVNKHDEKRLENKGGRRKRRKALLQHIKETKAEEDGTAAGAAGGTDTGGKPVEKKKRPMLDETALLERLRSLASHTATTGGFRVQTNMGRRGTRAVTALMDIGRGAKLGGGVAKVRGASYSMFTLHEGAGGSSVEIDFYVPSRSQCGCITLDLEEILFFGAPDSVGGGSMAGMSTLELIRVAAVQQAAPEGKASTGAVAAEVSQVDAEEMAEAAKRKAVLASAKEALKAEAAGGMAKSDLAKAASAVVPLIVRLLSTRLCIIPLRPETDAKENGDPEEDEEDEEGAGGKGDAVGPLMVGGVNLAAIGARVQARAPLDLTRHLNAGREELDVMPGVRREFNGLYLNEVVSAWPPPPAPSVAVAKRAADTIGLPAWATMPSDTKHVLHLDRQLYFGSHKVPVEDEPTKKVAASELLLQKAGLMPGADPDAEKPEEEDPISEPLLLTEGPNDEEQMSPWTETHRLVFVTVRLLAGKHLDFEVYDPLACCSMRPTLARSLCHGIVEQFAGLSYAERAALLRLQMSELVLRRRPETKGNSSVGAVAYQAVFPSEELDMVVLSDDDV